MTGIVVTGFMGTGKTVVGTALARLLGRPFIDTDREIERVTGRSVPELFDERGEEGFREVERRVVAGVLASDGGVIAVGGGALLASETRQALDGRHRVFCLTADMATIVDRLNGGTGRPLAGSPEALRDLLAQRAAVYAAFEQIDTTDRTVDEVAREIAARVEDIDLRLDVELNRRSDIVVGAGALRRIPELLARRRLDGTALLVTDRHVAGAGIAARVRDLLARSGRPVRTVELEPGEETKSPATLERLYGDCFDERLERGSAVIGVGGGVIGDLAGMLAATYLRGLHLVLIPTTLLAQVDASVGGKVGVDLPGGKNLVGAFYPADVVVVDPDVLATLPERELRNGLAEMIKIAAMRSAALFAGLERLGTIDDLRRDWRLAREALSLKVDVVRADPYERGIRVELNFGHTIGHAVEVASDYRLPHGHAVAVGMVAESRLAVRRGWTPTDVPDRLERLLERFGLPPVVAGLDQAAALAATRQDKKRASGRARIAVPAAIGRGAVYSLSKDDVSLAIELAVGGSA